MNLTGGSPEAVMPTIEVMFDGDHISLGSVRGVLIACYARFAASALGQTLLTEAQDEQLLDTLCELGQVCWERDGDVTGKALREFCELCFCRFYDVIRDDFIVEEGLGHGAKPCSVLKTYGAAPLGTTAESRD
jgi:hypothetical protein